VIPSAVRNVTPDYYIPTGVSQRGAKFPCGVEIGKKRRPR